MIYNCVLQGDSGRGGCAGAAIGTGYYGRNYFSRGRSASAAPTLLPRADKGQSAINELKSYLLKRYGPRRARGGGEWHRQRS